MCLSGLLPLGLGGVVGCPPGQHNWLSNSAGEDEPRPAIRQADNPFTPLAASDAAMQRQGERELSTAARLTILHVSIPRGQRAQAAAIWAHLREDAVDSAVSPHLVENGLRVGVGRREWWRDVKRLLDEIDGCRVDALEPIRVPPGYPLGLELDRQPHDQNLWVVERDGVLSGSSWRQSRNVLRLMYAIDRQHPERIVLALVPEVWQRMPGWRWVRSERGLWQLPKRGGRAFDAAGFGVGLEDGEFLVIAPSEHADVTGLIGQAFLTEESDGQVFDSYVFVSADLQNARQPG